MPRNTIKRGFFSSALPVLILVTGLSGCKKLVEVAAPSTFVNSENVFSSDATAIAAVTYIYTGMSASGFGSGVLPSISLAAGLSADEYNLYLGVTNSTLVQFYYNELSAANMGSNDFWNGTYPFIYNANAAIEGLNASAGLTPQVRQRLLGEAKFMRAFLYFYLVNIYGDVVMPLSTDYKVNAALRRMPKDTVYGQIIQDLKDAQGLLSDTYEDGTLLNATTERTRPNQGAATALLSRVYLFTNNYADAETQATAVISNGSLYGLSSLDSVFLMNSTETIWQLQPVNWNTYNTQEALFFILPSSGPNPTYPVALSNSLMGSWEAGDARRTHWVGSAITPDSTFYFPYKYKINDPSAPVSEYEMVMRLAEVYLIRAEAEANGAGGGTAAAVADLNIIRGRAGLAPYVYSTQADLLSAILHERQVELFSEWGHRWFDLKRSGTVDQVMSIVTPQKGGTWNTNWQWYPISLSELQLNPNLVQNAGY